jgi:hypothetical protein
LFRFIADNTIAGNSAGGVSSFGSFLSSTGGLTVTGVNNPAANGGSGGGGSCNCGGSGGAGGSGGSSGGGCTYAGGSGQGSYVLEISSYTII